MELNDIKEDSSIDLRKNIMVYEEQINNLRTDLNIINAERFNIISTNYNEIQKDIEYNLGVNLRYILFCIFIFFIINILLIYKGIIKKTKIKILFILCGIFLISILIYRYYKLKKIDKYIHNLKYTNNKKLLELNSQEESINKKILNIKIKITDLYTLLKYISKTN